MSAQELSFPLERVKLLFLWLPSASQFWFLSAPTYDNNYFLQIGLDTGYWTAINHFFIWGSLAVYFAILFAMHSNGLFDMFPNQFRFVGESLWLPLEFVRNDSYRRPTNGLVSQGAHPNFRQHSSMPGPL
jgi:hypothetical protein